MAQSYKALDFITVSDIISSGIAKEAAEELYRKLSEIIHHYGAATPQTWQHISKDLLSPELPFPFHQMMYHGCYKDFGADPPAWLPDP